MSLKLNSSGGGSVTLQEPTTASNFTLTLPAATATVATTTGTLTNPTINGFTGDTSVINVGSGQLYKDTSGNVGIGQTSPGAKLDVSGNIRLSAGNPNIEFNNGGAMVYGPAGNTLAFATGGGPATPTERFRIGSSGQLGIGGANYGTSGQVLTSQGSGSAPVWSTPSSGGVTSLAAGSGITVSASTGAVTVSQDIYTGSTVANSTYPIGTNVVVFDGASIGPFNVNSTFTVWSPGGNAFRFSNASTGSGSVTLTGTWRVRGNNTASPDGYCLMQRTA